MRALRFMPQGIAPLVRDQHKTECSRCQERLLHPDAKCRICRAALA